MRKVLAIAFLALLTAFGTQEAMAQVRIQPNVLQNGMVPRLKIRPRVQKVRPVNPKLILIPPSVALKRAMGAIPNAKAIGVKLKGPLYIVKLKQGGTITQVGVHAATGVILPLP